MSHPADRRTALAALELTNFRAFPALCVELHPELTVLAARNGKGKTALLDACALAWRTFVDTMRGAATSPGFDRIDVRRARTADGPMVDQLPVSLSAAGRIDGEAVTWRRELATLRGRTTYAEAHEVRDGAAALLNRHRPQVLSTVPRACIRVLELGPEGATATEPTEQTEGVASPDVLAAVMHVDPAPDLPVRRQLHRYRALIQDRAHDTDEGRALRATLTAHFGPAHPEVLDLDRLIRFRRVLSDRTEGRPA